MPDDHSELVPPLPIPNRTVKRHRADDSAATSVKVGNRQASSTASALPPSGRRAVCFARTENMAADTGNGVQAQALSDINLSSQSNMGAKPVYPNETSKGQACDHEAQEALPEVLVAENSKAGQVKPAN